MSYPIFHQLQSSELALIRSLAHRIWPHSFVGILSEAQIAYMLGWMYSLPSLQRQSDELRHRFFAINWYDEPVGFFAIEHDYQGGSVTRIHKVYLLPDAQGKGIGRAAFDFICKLACEAGDSGLHLNVNRYNSAVQFYEHYGFRITHTEDIDIGQGYWMEDFVMEMEL